jgi:hypothetical protein
MFNLFPMPTAAMRGQTPPPTQFGLNVMVWVHEEVKTKQIEWPVSTFLVLKEKTKKVPKVLALANLIMGYKGYTSILKIYFSRH